MSKFNEDLKKQKKKKYIIFTVSIIVIIIIIIKYVFFLYPDIVMRPSSMEPVLKNGWSYRLNKTAYWFSNPQRGDIIVAHPSNKSIGSVAKRIIGLPGEKIQIKDGKVYINDVQLAENYTDEYIKDSGCAEVPIILGKEDYFVLGDNSDKSFDSRYEDFGLIHRKNITGKITGPSLKNFILRYKNKSHASEI
jgi:signal peptidase I